MQHSSVTFIGNRKINEDSYGIVNANDTACYVVADGLGGHGKGEVAARLAVDAFKMVFSRVNGSLENMFNNAFQTAQNAIITEQNALSNTGQMKTTVCALAIRNGEVMWAHIGDSRVYAFSHGKVKKRTFDHSVPQMLVASKEIKESEIRFHPDRNRLLKALGEEGEILQKVEISKKRKLKEFQAFLLCSDGFWELVTEKEMERLLAESNTVEKWVKKMVKVAKKNKTDDMDNCTAIGVWV